DEVAEERRIIGGIKISVEILPDISQKCGYDSLRRTSDGRSPESAPCRSSGHHPCVLIPHAGDNNS
ncbi:MAG: hypothetical protein ACXW2R_02885, partial [Candidatus Aminicenantales bacterium]